jgi:hypothetical protein
MKHRQRIAPAEIRGKTTRRARTPRANVRRWCVKTPEAPIQGTPDAPMHGRPSSAQNGVYICKDGILKRFDF